MTSIITTPIPMAISVSAGPATGRKVVPGITKAPQPTMQPKAIAQTSSHVRFFFGAALVLFSIWTSPPLICDVLPRPAAQLSGLNAIYPQQLYGRAFHTVPLLPPAAQYSRYRSCF